MSRWAKLDVPSLKLASQLDTDHWAKLKGKVISIKKGRPGFLGIRYTGIFGYFGDFFSGILVYHYPPPPLPGRP